MVDVYIHLAAIKFHVWSKSGSKCGRGCGVFVFELCHLCMIYDDCE